MVLFGRIAGGRMVENRSARIVRNCWEGLPGHYPRVSLDAFVVMPDHVRGIVVLGNAHRTMVGRDRAARAGLKPAPTGWGSSTRPEVRHGFPEVVRAFKTFSARRINALCGTPGTAVWQRGYYEHVIRNERALKHIREYIRSNPQNWCKTPEHPNP